MKDIKDKIITAVLTIIIFIVPTLTLEPFIQADNFKINVATRAIALFICGIILLALLILKRKELKFDTIDKLLLIFYAIGWISTFFSTNIKFSLMGELNRYEGIFTIGIYLLIYYCAKNYFYYYKKFVLATFIMASLVGIYCILECYGFLPIHDLLGIPYNSLSPSACLTNANFLGSFISIFLPIAMCIFIFKKDKLYFLFSIILFGAMICTLTRSAWLAFAVYSFIGLIYLIVQKDKELWKRALLLFTAFVVCFLVILFTKGNFLAKRINTVVSETSTIVSSKQVDDSFGSGRIALWKMGVQSIINHPLIGCGPDCFRYILVKEQPEAFYGFFERFHQSVDKVHNEYLHIAITMGIPALIIYLLAIFSILESNLKKMFKNRLAFIFTLCIISYLVQAFFNISVIMVAPIFWFVLGLSNNEKFKKEMKDKI